MTITVRLFGHELFEMTIDLDDDPPQEITRAIGFAAAELAEPYEPERPTGHRRGQGRPR